MEIQRNVILDVKRGEVYECPGWGGGVCLCVVLAI
jgi:hypothetical protein